MSDNQVSSSNVFIGVFVFRFACIHFPCALKQMFQRLPVPVRSPQLSNIELVQYLVE